MSEKVYSIDEIRRIVAPIAVKYAVERIFLFGSYARGQANGSSDIDFLIDRGRPRGLMFAGMLGDLQERLQKNVDLLTSVGLAQNGENSDFKQKIEKDMILLYEH